MANGDPTLNGLSGLIVELRHEYTEAEKRLAEVAEQLRIAEAAARLYRQKRGIEEPDVFESLVLELQGKSQLEALLTIASKSNNIFKVTDAKRLMLQAGLISNPKNAASIIYTLISRSRRFGKIRPGEYKVLTEEEMRERQGFTPSEWEEENAEENP